MKLMHCCTHFSLPFWCWPWAPVHQILNIVNSPQLSIYPGFQIAVVLSLSFHLLELRHILIFSLFLWLLKSSVLVVYFHYPFSSVLWLLQSSWSFLESVHSYSSFSVSPSYPRVHCISPLVFHVCLEADVCIKVKPALCDDGLAFLFFQFLTIFFFWGLV